MEQAGGQRRASKTCSCAAAHTTRWPIVRPVTVTESTQTGCDVTSDPVHAACCIAFEAGNSLQSLGMLLGRRGQELIGVCLHVRISTSYAATHADTETDWVRPAAHCRTVCMCRERTLSFSRRDCSGGSAFASILDNAADVERYTTRQRVRNSRPWLWNFDFESERSFSRSCTRGVLVCIRSVPGESTVGPSFCRFAR